MNVVMLVGRLSKEPDVTYSQGAQGANAYGHITVVVDGRRKQDGTQDSQFINCSVFGGTADFVKKYMHKGTGVALRGRLRQNNYTTKEGVQQYSYDVVVESIEFTPGPPKQKADNAPAQQNGGYVQQQGNGQQNYGAPASAQAPAQQQNYGAPAQQQSQYNAPAPAQNQYNAPVYPQAQYSAPAPAQQQSQYNAPAQQYSAPAQNQYGAQAQNQGFGSLDFGDEELPFK